MKTAISREMCSVHTTQVSEYVNWCTNIIKTLEVNKHLLTCKNIQKQIISITIDRENDLREFVETFN
jgi:hypothetical protein